MDLGYGEGGKITRPQTSLDGLAVARDGSVFLISVVTVSKYDPSGKLDPSFGAGGRVTTAGFASRPVVDEAGNVYLVVDDTVMKLDAAGRPVPSFGGNGIARTGLWRVDGEGAILALLRAVDGGLFIVGTLPFKVGVAKLDASGHLDPSFGSAGTLVFDAPGAADLGGAVDNAGNLYLAGTVRNFSAKYPVVWKIDSKGRVDMAFGDNGMWRGPACEGFMFLGRTPVAIARDGGVVVATNCDSPTPGVVDRALVFKIDRAGHTLTAFRTSGLRDGIFGAGPDGAESTPLITDLVIAASGDIFVAGVRKGDLRSCQQFALAMLDPDGEPVTPFGSGGVLLDNARSTIRVYVQFDQAGRLYVAQSGEWPCPLGGVFRDPPARYEVNVYRLTS
ncbi:MAG TPA: hypothetical protein VM051_05280 [Usitatibacter sp.]|nr:hypothetical protein [Usitatibacter sp.]